MKFQDSNLAGLCAWLAFTGPAYGSLNLDAPLPQPSEPYMGVLKAGTMPQQKDETPLPKADLEEILNDTKAIVAQSEAVSDLYSHARLYHVEVKYFDLRDDVLSGSVGPLTLAKNALNADLHKSRIDIDIAHAFLAIEELKKKNIPVPIIKVMMARAYSSVTVHELGHHRLGVQVTEQFPEIKVFTQSMQNEGVALAQEALFLEEGSRKNFKVGAVQEPFDLALSRGADTQDFSSRYVAREGELLAAARKGRAAFKQFVREAYPTEFSAQLFIGHLQTIQEELAKVTLSDRQKTTLMSQEELTRLKDAIASTKAAMQSDAALAGKIKDQLDRTFNEQLDRMSTVFRWTD